MSTNTTTESYQLQEGDNPFLWFSEHPDDKSVKLQDGSVMKRPAKDKLAAELKKLKEADAPTPETAGSPENPSPATPPAEANTATLGGVKIEATKGLTTNPESIITEASDIIFDTAADTRAIVLATLISGMLKTLPYPREEKDIAYTLNRATPLADAIMAECGFAEGEE